MSERKFSDSDWAIWDRACARASIVTRGLGFEALSRALPLSWSGSTLLATFPEPVLCMRAAVESAQARLREAFASPALELIALPPTHDFDPQLCWASREARRQSSQHQADFESMLGEDLPQALRSALAAEFGMEHFKAQ